MSSNDRVYLRFGALLAVGAVVALVAGGLTWPSSSLPAPAAPELVHITSVDWSVVGCPVSNYTGPGLVVVGGSWFTAGWTLTEPVGSRACTIGTAEVGTANFSLLAVTTPLFVVPGGFANCTARLAAPDGYLTTTLTIHLLGRAGP